MLIGEYTHTLDPKRRLLLPVKFRKTIGDELVITRGLEHSLFLYPLREWNNISKRVGGHSFTQSDTRAFSRFMHSSAYEVEIDSAGRILIPEALSNFAGLKDKVILAGVRDRIELWDESKWRQYISEIEKDADEMAQRIS